jgi:PhnB protein
MAAKVKPIPDQYQGAVPYLCCKGAAKAIEFYKKAFSAVELARLDCGGGIGHAEIKIGGDRPGGGAIIMLADEYPDMGFRSPETIGGTPAIVYIYVEDVDALAKQAIEAGAKVLRPLADQFYGDRTISLQDPFGHVWGFATHIEDLSFEEIQRRASAKHGGG